MALCKNCAFMNERYDQFRQEYNDAVPVDDKQTQYFCPMYDDHIPNDIYYENGKCQFYQSKEN